MAKITYSRSFDIQKQFYLADWSDATITATLTSVTLQLGGATLLLSGTFRVSGSQPVDGQISGLTYSTGTTTPVTEFTITGLSLSLNQALTAMADGDLAAVFGAGNDVAAGTLSGDRIYGYGGNDRLEGLGGNDTLFGSYGNDTLDGGTGSDSMQGGSGDDTYVVDATGDRIAEVLGGGTDSVQTSLANYTLVTQLENLTYTGIANFTGIGNAANNVIIGSKGNDTLSGLDGNDTLRGGNGHDVLRGGNGNDYLIGDAGANAWTTTASGVSPTDATRPITLSMTLPETSTTSSATVTGYVNNANLDAPFFNLAFVLDISGSMVDPFSGASVGDVNGNGSANEKVDAAIAAFNALVNSIKAAGLASMTRIALIPFAYSADIRAVGTPASDADANGVADLIEAAQKLNGSGGTYYGYGLDKAIDFFNGSPQGNNFVFFLSDGQPSDSSYAPQLNTLRDDAGIDATIRSLGFEAASSGYLNVLDLLDDDKANNSAIDVKTPENLTAGLLSSQVKIGDVKQLEIYSNGKLLKTLTPAQLTETPFGLKYSVTIDGLSSTAANNIETRLVLSDGANSYISTNQQINVGGFASNDSLEGGAGNDTLDGGAGTDTLIGGAGNDLYHVETTAAVIRELVNEGTDTVETTINYSLNSSALKYIENLTLLGSNNINGTGNASGNRIEGNMGNNVLSGLGGNDTLIGGYGVDIVSYANFTQGITVNLGAGTASATGKADQLSGIEGVWGSNFADSLVGGNGDDIFRGNGGNDTISGGNGMDTVDYSAATAGMTVSLNYSYYNSYYGIATCADGSQGTDYIHYSDVEIVIGSAFNDSLADLYAYGSNNRFDGGDGNDSLNGGSGNDTLIGGKGNDTLQGGTGTDVADYSTATAAITGSLVQGKITVGTGTNNVDTLGDIEQIIGSKYADSLAGSLQGDILLGGAGNDSLSGDAGNDTLNGGIGNDSMSGGAGDDVFYVDAAGDVFEDALAGGLDTVYFQVAGGKIAKNLGQVEVAYLSGGALYSITGGAVQNNITGGQGNDTINGGVGMETDTLSGGAGVDWLSYAGHQSAVRGTINQSYYNTIDGDITSGFENFLGSDYTDVVSGDSYNNILDGGKGDDSLNGGNGDDTLVGGAGNDQLDGDYGFDTVSYAHLTTAIKAELSTGVVTTTSEGSDTLVEIEHIIGGTGADSIVWSGTSISSVGYYLEGGAGNDTLIGNYYADTLVGGAGDDSLNGGNVSNPYYYNYVDVVDYSAATAAVVVDLAAGTATGGGGLDKLANIEGVIGSAFADKLLGSTQQADYFTGGAGADTMDGGIDSYSDVFVYKNISDSSGKAVDTLKNFIASGYYADRIDLSAIDAITTDAYDSYFNFIGTVAFSGKAGELRYENTATDTFVYGDVNGDKVADLSIKLLGVVSLSSYSFSL